jgi:hypothetical protein
LCPSDGQTGSNASGWQIAPDKRPISDTDSHDAIWITSNRRPPFIAGYSSRTPGIAVSVSHLSGVGYTLSGPASRTRRRRMAVVNPLPKEKAAAEVHETYEGITKQFGKIPNIFATMAHRPNVLKNFLPFYGAIINEGTVEARYKELAYLKTSLLNGCEY